MASVKSKWYIKSVTNKICKAGLEGVKAVALELGDRSQAVTPVEDGWLETSMTVSDDGRTTVMVSYATDEGYAIIQHEDTSLNHDVGKQAKYLEQPAFEYVPQVLGAIVGSEIDKACR